MNETKERYTVEIADVQLSILSDEREDFIKAVVDQLDREIREMTVRNKRCSKLDAALLIALDYCADYAKAEKRIRNLETQIALYDANLRRMREEVNSLKARCGMEVLEEKAAEPVVEAPTAEVPAVEAPVAEATKAETPVAEAPKAATPAPEAPKAEAPASGGDKLRQLELILRGMKPENNR